jgi:hypothetical protein
MDGQIKRIPVTYKGKYVGHTDDEGKTINFHDIEEAKRVIELINTNERVFVSSIGIGKVDEDGVIRDHQIDSYNISHFDS